MLHERRLGSPKDGAFQEVQFQVTSVHQALYFLGMVLEFHDLCAFFSKVGTKSPLVTRYRELACRTGLGQDTYPKFFSGSVSGAKIVDGPKTMSYLMSLDGTLKKKAWRKLPILFFVLLSQIRLIKPPNQKKNIRVAGVPLCPIWKC